MARKPLTVNAGRIEQLPPGIPIDAGGWIFPTVGGTQGYALVADALGDAVWASVGSSSLPDPTVDDQVLISTGVGTATWSTAAANQVIASDSLGEVAWLNKPFGFNIPANSAVNEVYVGTGVGTAAWTTDLVGLTSLTVDDITIDGTSIDSSSSVINFTSVDLVNVGKITSGKITATHSIGDNGTPTANFIRQNSAGGAASKVLRLEFNDTTDLIDGTGPAINFDISDSASGPNTIASIAGRRRNNSDTSGSLDFFTSDAGVTVAGGRFEPNGTLTLLHGLAITGTTIVNGDITGVTLLEVDNITIDGDTITSDTGGISFGDDNLVTTGTVVGSNIPSPLNDDQVLISTSVDTASWMTAGNNKVLASNATGAVAWETKPFGYQVAAPTVDDQVLISTSANTASWVTAGNDQYLASDNLGEVAWVAKPISIPDPTVAGQLYQATGVGTAAWTTDLVGITNLTVDNININGATISSDTGAISFSNEHLTTTGSITANSLVSTYSTKYTDGSGTGYSGLFTFSGAVTETGTCVIDLPSGFLDTMMAVRILGYNYTGANPGGWGLVVGGYTYGAVGRWIKHHASIQGNPPFTSVRLGWNGNTNKACIMLGTTTSAWSYPVVHLESMAAGFSNQTVYQAGWAISFYTDEANFVSQPGYYDPQTVEVYRDLKSPTAIGQIPVSNSAGGDVTWGTSLTTLTNLTVGNININGATISSDTGVISFSNENLTTTGTITANSLVSTYSTKYTDGSGTGYSGLFSFGGGASENGMCVIDLPNGFQNTMMAVRILGHVYTIGEGAWSIVVGGYTDAAGGKWTHHNASIQGNPPFTSVRLGWNGNTNKACIMFGTTSTNWAFPTIHIESLAASYTNQTAYQSGWAVNFYTDETNFVSQVGYADPQTVEVYRDLRSPTAAGQIPVSNSTGGDVTWTSSLTTLTNLTVDNININGATISSDTGAISFSNENLTTTGTITASNLSASGTNTADKFTSTYAMMYTDGSGTGYSGLHTHAIHSQPVNGTCVIDLPNGFQDTMMTIRILGYNYSTSGGWSLVVGGYPYTSQGRWLQHHASIQGNPPFTSIRLGWNGNTNKACIMLGITSSVWDYPVIHLESMAAGVVNGTAYQSGWAVNFYTDETNFFSQVGYYDPVTVEVYRDLKSPTSAGQIPISNSVGGDVTWGTSLTTLTNLTVDNININGATISSDTGAISFSNENLTTTGTVTGSNISSPTAAGQALSSTAADAASWNVTGLSDVLAQEVPTASGSQRKYVLTANSASKFEIEPAPWPLTIFANETIYVRTTGNDTTGKGTSGAPFLTLTKTIEYLGGLYIGDYTVIVDIGEGVFAETGTLSFQHPFGSQVIFQGVSEQITNQDTNSIGATGVSLGFNNLYYYDVTFILPVGKSISVGEYISVREVAGGTLPQALYGCHYVSGWDGGTRTATVRIVYKNGSPKASGVVTCTVELIKTVISFSNNNGLKINGSYTGGFWRGLVIQGDYNTTNTESKYGVWAINSAVVRLGGDNTSGNALGIVGFQTGLYAQNNAMIFGDYSFVSRNGLRCINAQNGGILNIRYGRLSGANNGCIFAFNGSTIAANSVKCVAAGNDTVFSYQGSFIDASSSYVDQNNATNAFTADRWAAMDITGSTYTDALNPVTNGNNFGSYIIT